MTTLYDCLYDDAERWESSAELLLIEQPVIMLPAPGTDPLFEALTALWSTPEVGEVLDYSARLDEIVAQQDGPQTLESFIEFSAAVEPGHTRAYWEEMFRITETL